MVNKMESEWDRISFARKVNYMNFSCGKDGLLFHLNVFIFHFVYSDPCSLFIIFVVIYMQIVEDLETLIESQKAAQKDGGSPVHPHHHHTCCATCSFVSPTGSTTPPDSSQNTDSELSGRMPFLVLL